MITFINKQLCLIVLFVFTGAMSVGCGTTPDPNLARVTQQDAIDRWTQCIERAAETYAGPFTRVYQYTEKQCDGYHRDVLLTFPIHLENKVSQLLSKKAAKMTTVVYVKTNNAVLADQSKDALEKLNNTLIEGQNTDL